MRKELKKIATVMLAGTMLFTMGCGTNNKVATDNKSTRETTVMNETTEQDENEEITTEKEALTYPEFLTKNLWERNNGSCTEVIYFLDNGDFGYSCSCGNPVGDADLYQEYSYDEKTGIITVYGEDNITIEVIESDDDSLTLQLPEELEEGEKTFTVLVDDSY